MPRHWWVFAALLTFVPVSDASAQVLDDWRQFRAQHPYHIQVVALSGPRTDGARTIIISEPPPHITAERVRELLPEGARVQFPRQAIGHDGWVQDAAASLPPLRDDELRHLVHDLHLALFGTAYKAYAVPIGGRAAAAQPPALDLDVSAAELERWIVPPERRGPSGWALFVFWLSGLVFLRCAWRLVRGDRSLPRFAVLVAAGAIAWVAVTPSAPEDPSLRFARVGVTESRSGAAIFDASLEGVFHSIKPGIVVFAASTAKPLAEYTRDLRQFAIDSDLILGGVKRGSHVVIVGRERVTPVDLLPPLRTETMLRLASVEDDELAQSYERRNVYAGRFDGTRDWAPIYLSDALLDTEYGSLLNITDQLLKSWSMHGDVQYINFPYPQPQSYPFPTSLAAHTGAKSVTFNWNTKGAGYVVTGRVEVLALNRTGALPVDYLGSTDERLAEAEDTAYDYFAATQDPNLVRVVQYAGLYQAFRRFGITNPAPKAPPTPVPAAASRASRAIVESLREISLERLQNAIGRVTDDGFRAELEHIAAIKQELDSFAQDEGDPGLDRLAAVLAAPRNYPVPADPAAHTLEARSFVLASAMMRVGGTLQYMARLPMTQVLRDYVADSRRVPRETWIRTPSVVVSWARAGSPTEGAVGGHNLSAKISRLEPDASLAPGAVQVVERGGERVLLYSPADSPRVSALVRTLGRSPEKGADEVADILKQRLPSAPHRLREVDAALRVSSSARQVRGLQPEQVPGTLKDLGWKATKQELARAQKEMTGIFVKPDVPGIVVERSAEGRFLIYAGEEFPVLTAGDTPAAVDAVLQAIGVARRQRPDVQLHLRGFQPRQGSGFVDTVELNMPKLSRGRLVATLDDGRPTPAALKRVLTEEYDVSRARIREVTHRSPGRVDVDVVIPAKAAQRPSLLMRIQLFFKHAGEITQQAMTRLQAHVAKWLQSVQTAPENFDVFLAARQLKADLRRIHPSLERVEIEVPNEAGDVFIVRHWSRLELPDAA